MAGTAAPAPVCGDDYKQSNEGGQANTAQHDNPHYVGGSTDAKTSKSLPPGVSGPHAALGTGQELVE